MDADELAGAFVELKSEGKVLHFGVSNFSVSQFELLASRLPFPLVTNQLEFSLLHPQPMYDGTFDQCQQRRISPMAWSPLGGGRIMLDESPPVLRLRQALDGVGLELGATADQVALAWILRHPARVVVIIGTTNITRMRSAAAAVELNLSRPQWFTLLKAATGTDVP
jgi:predicted oxidoreductase